MSRKNPEDQPDTEAFAIEFDVDPNVMSAPDQAEVERLSRLRELADDPTVYDPQLAAIIAKYNQ